LTLVAYLEHLFGMATGWLGWSPEVAWRSTVAEIRVAVKARVRWQQMCNGVEEEETPDMKASKLKAFLQSRVKRG
jgi:hypothetical protein